jgi:EF hand
MKFFPGLSASVLTVLVASQASAFGGPHLLEKADTNGDGTITRVELRSAAEALFVATDANRDGYIVPEELMAAHAKRHEGNRPHQGGEGDNSHGKGLKGPLRRADVNGDEKISKQEALRASEKLFDWMDANDDGVLKGQETEFGPGMRAGHGGPRGHGHASCESHDK